MKRRLVWLLLFAWLGPGAEAGAAAGPTLTGRVLLGFQGTDAAKQVKLSLGGLNPTLTDHNGVFVLSLPPTSHPGLRIKLDLAKPGYCVLSPYNGEVVVPEDHGATHPVEIRLLRSESRQGTTEDCLAKVIEAAANKPKPPTQPGQQPEPLNLPREIKGWLEKQGVHITDEQAKGELERWVTDVKSQPRTDLHVLGLQRMAERSYTEARKLFTRAAEEAEKKLVEQVVGNYRLAGDAAREELDFEAALASYQKALEHVSRSAQPALWAELAVLVGATHGEIGDRITPTLANEHLVSAVAHFRQALLIYNRQQQPQGWAKTQNNLGYALFRQGERAAGAESQRLLAEAVAAYRLALQVYTLEQQPQDWALTQNNLGSALLGQGQRAAGAESQRLLAEAVAVYQLALQVRTREQQPQGWGHTQSNLGSAFLQQAARAAWDESQQLLAEAVAAYRLALQVRTREQQPQDWALTQNNLGGALILQGEQVAGAERQRLLAEAIAAHRLALQVYTREQLPQDWAHTQNSLGGALLRQGEQAAGAESQRLLVEAVAAYRLALQVQTREQLPQYWAHTQNGLGSALLAQGERAAGAESQRLLAEAVAAYRLALQVRTREQLPQDWAETQYNLGVALQKQGERAVGAESQRLLSEAVTAYRLALQVYTREEQPQGWAQTQYRLSTALQKQVERAASADSQKLLGEAVHALWSVLELYPDSKHVVTTAFLLCQDRLAEFERAYELSELWLNMHPEDLNNQADFAEAHLTNGNFAESARRLTELLHNPKLPARKIGRLQLLKIVALSVPGETKDLPALLKSLRATLAARPDTFALDRPLAGVKTFLQRDVRPTPRIDWLLKLISAAENPTQAARLRAWDSLLAHQPLPPS